MFTNNDVPLVREMYAGYHIENVNALRCINRDGSKRKAGKEVIITNY